MKQVTLVIEGVSVSTMVKDDADVEKEALAFYRRITEQAEEV